MLLLVIVNILTGSTVDGLTKRIYPEAGEVTLSVPPYVEVLNVNAAVSGFAAGPDTVAVHAGHSVLLKKKYHMPAPASAKNNMIATIIHAFAAMF